MGDEILQVAATLGPATRTVTLLGVNKSPVGAQLKTIRVAFIVFVSDDNESVTFN